MCTPLKILNGTSKTEKLSKAKTEVFRLRQTLRKTERDNAKTAAATTAKTKETLEKITRAFYKMREAKSKNDRTISELRSVIARMIFNSEIMCRNAASETKGLRNRVAELEDAARAPCEETNKSKRPVGEFVTRRPPVALPPLRLPERMTSAASTLRLSSFTIFV